ncbi:MAG TPA: enoyl-CoA hydratase-related protein [Candidatus Methanoperedens sp.]
MNTGNERIKIEKRKEIGIITFNRPEVMNIVDTETLLELADSLTDLETDTQIRVIIITGDKTFSSGADVTELKEKHPDEAGVFSRLGHNVCNHVENMVKPVIAAVNGYALGAGCEIALACDIRIAGESAKFGQPEVNLGLIPGFGATQRLTRLVGIGWAKELILSGRIIDAIEAESIGLVNNVVEDNELMAKAKEMAQVLAQKSPIALKAAKGLINQNLDIKRGLEMEIFSFSRCFASQDHIEGINAFMEKRKPKFEGT